MNDEDTTHLTGPLLPPLTGTMDEPEGVSARQLIDEAKSDPRFIVRAAWIDELIRRKAERLRLNRE